MAIIKESQIKDINFHKYKPINVQPQNTLAHKLI